MHILEEWRIRDIEQKASRAADRLYELDALRSDVGNLERANRDLCTTIDGLRHTLDTAIERITALENTMTELAARGGAA